MSEWHDIKDIPANYLDMIRHYFLDVVPLTHGGVAIEHSNDLVVSFVVVNHAKPSDRPALNNEIPVVNGARGEDADVNRVAITFDILFACALHASLSHCLATVSLRKKPINGR